MAAGDNFEKIRGVSNTLFQMGLLGPNIKNNSGVIEIRNAADGAYEICRFDDPVGNDDGVNLRHLNATTLYYSEAAGTPEATVTPQRVGHVYKDTATNFFYIAVGLTNTDWQRMIGAEYSVPADNDILRYSLADGEYKNSQVILDRQKVNQYFADDFDVPNNVDWAVSTPAPIVTDGSLRVIEHANGTERGVGFSLDIPAGSTNMRQRFQVKPQTPPGTQSNLEFTFYAKEVTDGGAVGAWSVGYAFTLIIPAGLSTYTWYEIDIPTATLGLSPAKTYRCELTRTTATAPDVAGNVYMYNYQIGTVEEVIQDTLAIFDGFANEWDAVDGTASFPVLTPALFTLDPSDNSIPVIQFANGTEYGALVELFVSGAAANIDLTILARAQSAPGVASLVAPKLYWKSPTDLVWTSSLLTELAVPTDANYHGYTITLNLPSLSIPRNDTVQFVFSRVTASATDLPGNWLAHQIGFRQY